MRADLDGAHALVTAGGSGIGLACAKTLLAQGATVTIAGRTEARLASAAEMLESHSPGRVRTAVCDVADEEAVSAAVARAARPDGTLDICVAGAGTGTLGPVVALPLAQWQDVMATNLTGAFLTIKHAGAAMVRNGSGSIVAISSIAAPLTHRFMAAYCVSKAGLEALVRTAADELGQAGVRVNAVRPSLVPTELAAPLDDDPQVRADYLAQMPLGRVGTGEDVAEIVAFLAGPRSTWITGTAVDVDGGHHLRRGPDVEHWVRGLFGDDVTEGRV